ncbi:YTH domain-containing protein ECT3 isoform X2 [Manihot esculenta]|uniref:Uncharacterized protein n=2 Tax=Manihot esculenta TaxID=3983 RepID=A0ACB7G8E3_MANES|nr:YTH domain-containing protein ECT3 isoform X2 [Manihot esculenta]KAG8636504.1 hypothetical protein MANES_15G003300v8 [Manihot esculenta]KAG8636505.1 hypothetical protein MANES_15G003300v8 [Manihot esculenta]
MDITVQGAQSESLPYVYYTPSYGYAQSPYNPYNPYIPGAMIGVDGPYVGAQQYYAMPPYQDPVSSPGYVPVVVQPDFIPNNSTDPLLDAAGVAFTNRPDGRSSKHGLASSSAAFPKYQSKPTSNQTNTLSKISEGSRANVGSSKMSLTHGSISAGSFPTPASSHMLQGRGASGSIQPVDNFSSGKVLPHSNQLKVAVPINNGFSDFGSSAPGRAGVDKVRSKIHVGRTLNDVNGGPDSLGEQNRGPRTNKSKNQLAVKAYTTKVGDDEQGNIIIYTDQYNKDDFPVDYGDAKFFVIKSYSEDDVHKSIKYNVWSSTPNGNKKLQSAYDDAQKIAAGDAKACPIFLFFSVNASGQFCGVAEMIGPVDFAKDMDFWQQDKWSGSFPVKWHIIKDVPNSSFRHIILENNENKPVTNSRDTQEIMYKQGLEMLKIFKIHTSKTSILDDFMYYENRQRIMQEEKARLIFKRFETPFLVPALEPAHKLDCLVELPPNKDEKTMEQKGTNCIKKSEDPLTDQVTSNFDVAHVNNESKISEQAIAKSGGDVASFLKIGSLSINPKQAEPKPFPDAAPYGSSSDSVDVVTVGSMPVKVNGFAESSGFLRVGSIPLDPRALQRERGGAFAKYQS